MKPKLTVRRDFDGYFEALVSGWISRKTEPFRHTEIIVTSGPYRSDAVTYESDGTILRLDFYSALRSGFGRLDDSEVQQLIALL